LIHRKRARQFGQNETGVCQFEKDEVSSRGLSEEVFEIL